MYRPSQTPRLAVSSDRITLGSVLPVGGGPRKRPPSTGRGSRRATPRTPNDKRKRGSAAGNPIRLAREYRRAVGEYPTTDALRLTELGDARRRLRLRRILLITMPYLGRSAPNRHRSARTEEDSDHAESAPIPLWGSLYESGYQFDFGQHRPPSLLRDLTPPSTLTPPLGYPMAGHVNYPISPGKRPQPPRGQHQMTGLRHGGRSRGQRGSQSPVVPILIWTLGWDPGDQVPYACLAMPPSPARDR
ncbi:hypothetical protein AAG570_004836 [Ranatra chinensis]|uniref:Uncharacterized protein n=1 Tax=Ranatra chinensis TaxID=642074 RepID=A0ABD0XYP0_9HEMI